jgi:long-chain fatty acid transport protein
MRICFRFCFVAVLANVLFAASAWAGGLWLYEQATPDMGVAAAGRQAAAMDASTASGNPAGMTRLERSQLETGIMGIYPVLKFDTQEASEGGGDGGNAGYFTPGATFYYVHSLSPDLKLGLGSGSYFGLGLDYSDKWAGRYYAQSAEFLTAGVNPSIGYRVNRWLSIGGGFSIVYGELTNKTAINNLLPSQGDGRLKYDATDVGYGFNGGVLFELSPQTRFGVTYISKVKLDFKDELKFKNLGPGLEALLDARGLLDTDLKIDWNMPQQVAIGAYHAITDKLAVLASANWQDWSEFGTPEISLSDGPNVSEDLDYDDTWHIGLGVQYRVADPWLLMAGWGYDSSPISSDSDRSPSLPLDRQLRYAGGVQYDWNENVTVGAAYTLIDAGKNRIKKTGNPVRGDLEGKYDSSFIHVFNLNFIYRF